MVGTQQICDNCGMPPKKAPEIAPMPEPDLFEFCSVIENLTGYNQRQMAEVLNVKLITYQSWRRENNRREPGGDAVARLCLLRDKLQEQYKIIIPIPLKK